VADVNLDRLRDLAGYTDVNAYLAGIGAWVGAELDVD
jgi:hypothetical protein